MDKKMDKIQVSENLKQHSYFILEKTCHLLKEAFCEFCLLLEVCSGSHHLVPWLTYKIRLTHKVSLSVLFRSSAHCREE